MSALKGAQDLTSAFWEAAAARRLVRPVCDSCGRSFFSPSWSCPHCGSEAWTYERSTGRGRVYSFTVVHRPPDPSWPAPYVLAIIDLDEDWSMLSRVELDPGSMAAVEASPGQLIGRAVEVTFRPEGRAPHRVLPVFVPVAAATGPGRPEAGAA